jgi:hypothetical protein
MAVIAVPDEYKMSTALDHRGARDDLRNCGCRENRNQRNS